MKLALSTKIYRFLPLGEVLEIVAEAGFSHVEVFADRPHLSPSEFTAAKASELLKHLQKFGLSLSSLDTSQIVVSSDEETVCGCSWLSEDWKERERRIKYTLDCARIAASLGTPQIIISAGSPVPPLMDYKEAWRLFAANMFRILPVIDRLGVDVVVKPAGGILMSRFEQLYSLLQELDFPERIGLDLDVAHTYCMGEDLCEVVHQFGSFIKNVHVSDGKVGEECHHLPFGEGNIDISSCLKCLKKVGYKGVLTVSFDVAGKLPEEVTASSAKYLKGFVDEVEN